MKTPVNDLMVGSMLMAWVGLAGCRAEDALNGLGEVLGSSRK